MYITNVDWSDLKSFIDTRTLAFQFIETSNFYDVVAFDGPFALTCRIQKNNGTPQTEFEASYKSIGNKPLVLKDADNVALTRTKLTASGWHYQMYGLEFETGKLGSVVNNGTDGLDLGHTTIKFYDSNDVELTTQTSIDLGGVKTVVDWEPDWDYEIIGGQFRQLSVPGSDIRLHIVAVPDVPVGLGGSIPFVNNINLRFVGTEDAIDTDGRTSKRLTYHATNHTNKLRIILEHGILVNHKIQLMFELFRA